MENNFEKKLQEKAEGFDMNPSAEVWKNVHRELHGENKKRRYWFLFFGLLIGLVAGGSAIWFLFNGHDDSPMNGKNIAQVSPKENSIAVDSSFQKNSLSDSVSVKVSESKTELVGSSVSMNDHHAPTPTHSEKVNHISVTRETEEESTTQETSLATLTSTTDDVPSDKTSSQEISTSEISDPPTESDSTLNAMMKEVTDSIVSYMNSIQPLSKPDHRFYAGAQFSPDYSYRFLTDQVDSTKFIRDLRDSTESAEFGFTTSAFVGYHFNQHWSVQAGAGLTKMGEHYEQQTISLTVDSDNSSGYAVPVYHYDTTNVPLNKNYFYFHFPITVQYQFGTHRVNYFVTGGIAVNVLKGLRTVSNVPTANLNSSLNTFATTGTTTFTNSPYNVNRINLDLLLGAGINWDLSDRFSLQLAPTYRMSLMKINSEGSIHEYLYSLGANGGILFHF